MAVPTVLVDSASEVPAKVTLFGQLVTAPISYSTPITKELSAPSAVFNFIEPSANQSIVITDIIVSADKNVSNTTPAEIEIFEADTIISATSIETILSPRLIRSANLPLTGLNLIVPEGRFVNATTNDAAITITIMFYRVPTGNV